MLDRIREFLDPKKPGGTEGMGVKNNVSGPAGGPRPLSSSRLSIVYGLSQPVDQARQNIDVDGLSDRLSDSDDIEVSTNVSIRPGRFDAAAELVVGTRASILFRDQLDQVDREVQIVVGSIGPSDEQYIATR